MRHSEVHEDDVRVELLDERDRLVAIGGSADDLNVVHEPKHHRQPFADDAPAVGDYDGDHAGIHSSTRNPSSVRPESRWPPISSARSRIPVSPYPLPAPTADGLGGAGAAAWSQTVRRVPSVSSAGKDPPLRR